VKRRDQALRMLRNVNPVPETMDLSDEAASPQALRQAFTERRSEMQTQDSEMQTQEMVGERAQPRFRRPVVGFAVVLMVAAVAIATILVTRDGAAFDAASATDVEVVQEFVERLNIGDADGAVDLVAASPANDFLFPIQDRHLGFEGLAEFFEFYEGTDGTTDVSNCTDVPGQVICDATQMNALWDALGAPAVEGQMRFSVGEGGIAGVAWSLGPEPISTSRALFDAYKVWIEDERPDLADEAISGNGYINTTGTADLHLQLVDEYVASR
jgi:hypothetical protein